MNRRGLLVAVSALGAWVASAVRSRGDGVALKSTAHPQGGGNIPEDINPESTLTLWAARGELVTCENGHSICEVSKDLWYGEMQGPGKLINWTQPEPIVGALEVAPCKICGARWWRGDLALQGNFHFEDGWR